MTRLLLDDAVQLVEVSHNFCRSANGRCQFSIALIAN